MYFDGFESKINQLDIFQIEKGLTVFIVTIVWKHDPGLINTQSHQIL